MVVGAVLDEGAVAQVAPENGRHAQLVRLREGLGHLLQLPRRLLGSPVHGRADGDGTQLERLLDIAEHHLVVAVRVGEQLVVVELADEGDAVRVFARHGAEDAEGRRHRVAAALDGELDDAFAVEVLGVGCE